MPQKQELYFFPVNQTVERSFEINISNPDRCSEDEKLETRKCTELSTIVIPQNWWNDN